MDCKTPEIKSGLKALLNLCLMASLISCQTITVSPEGKPKLSSPPDYQQTQHFFLGGLIGEAVVPAGEICKERSVAQLQSQTTFLNGLWPWLGSLTGMVVGSVVFLGSVTGMMEVGSAPSGAEAAELLGAGFLVLVGTMLAAVIYTPKTAKVWCGEKIAVPVPPAAADSSETKEAS